MKNNSVDLEVLRDKLNSNIEHLKHSGAVERNGDLTEDEMLLQIGYYLDELLQYQKVTVEPRVSTSKKGLLGKILILFKRLARKIVAWYLQPVCDDQTRYNHLAYLTMKEMNALVKQMIEKKDDERR